MIDNFNQFKSNNTLYIFDFDNTLVNTPNFNKLAVEYLSEDIKSLIDDSVKRIGKSISDLNIENGRIYINDDNYEINKYYNWVRKKNRLYLTEPIEYLNDIVSLPDKLNSISQLYKNCKNKAIVTARPISSKNIIIHSMDELGLEQPNYGLFMYPGGLPQRIWKSKTISKLINDSNFKRVRFYDDKPKVVKEVRKYINRHNKNINFKSIKYEKNREIQDI